MHSVHYFYFFYIYVICEEAVCSFEMEGVSLLWELTMLSLLSEEGKTKAGKSQKVGTIPSHATIIIANRIECVQTLCSGAEVIKITPDVEVRKNAIKRITRVASQKFH